MPFALPHTTVATAARRDDGVLRLHSGGRRGRRRGAARRTTSRRGGGPRRLGRLPGRRGLGAAGGRPAGRRRRPPLRVARCPPAPGLSSSAALEVVTALALNDLYELGLERPRWPGCASGPRTPTSARPPGSWTRRPRRAAPRATPCTWTPATCPAPDPVRPGGARPANSWSSTPGSSTPTARASTASAARAARRARRRSGVPALRDVALRGPGRALARLDGPRVRGLVRHIVTENHRVEGVIALLDAGEAAPSGRC